jgi:hypothetical protein
VPGGIFARSRMRHQGMDTCHELPGPKIDYSANYRPILLSERASHFRIKIEGISTKLDDRQTIDLH